MHARNLLRHPAILDDWQFVADSLGEHVDIFIQWCLVGVGGFIRLLGGDRIRISLEEHREIVLGVLFERWVTFSSLDGGRLNNG